MAGRGSSIFISKVIYKNGNTYNHFVMNPSYHSISNDVEPQIDINFFPDLTSEEYDSYKFSYLHCFCDLTCSSWRRF